MSEWKAVDGSVQLFRALGDETRLRVLNLRIRGDPEARRWGYSLAPGQEVHRRDCPRRQLFPPSRARTIVTATRDPRGAERAEKTLRLVEDGILRDED